MPGYCVAGTVGHRILSGVKKIEIDKKMVNVRLSVQYMSFRSVSTGTVECCGTSCRVVVCNTVLMQMLKGSCSSSDRFPDVPWIHLKALKPVSIPGCPESCDAGSWRGC